MHGQTTLCRRLEVNTNAKIGRFLFKFFMSLVVVSLTNIYLNNPYGILMKFQTTNKKKKKKKKYHTVGAIPKSYPKIEDSLTQGYMASHIYGLIQSLK
jgi:hypothetical protein